MVLRIKKGTSGKSLLDTIREMSGVDLTICYQCKKCSCGCPVSGHTESPPSLIIRRLQLGAAEEIFNSDLIWTCSSCETCFVRCPMGIDMASVMDGLRVLAVASKTDVSKEHVPLFNRAFLKTVKMFGRTYDLAMIAAYKAGTSTFMQDMDKFPKMIKKRKIAILPPRGADKKTVKQIFDNVDSNREKRK